MAAMIFAERYERFLTACQNIQRYRERLAKPVIDAELQLAVHAELPNGELLSHIMAEALLRRIDRSLVDSKNIYLQRFDVSQIDLFYLMSRAYPQVAASHPVANQHLAHELRSHRRAAVVEIGVGKGVQMAGLLRMLAERRGSLEALDLFAIDPSTDNLRESERVLTELGNDLPFALRVHTIEALVERMTPADLARIKDAAAGPIVMNSAFSIHHTVHAPRDVALRTDVMKRLAALEPRVFTLIEPSSNHDVDHLTKRFHACWEHFGTVFDLIDESDVESGARFVIKEKFFGREIRDIFGTSDAFRCERHEPYESWMLRLAKAGFAPYDAIPLRIDLPPYCSARVDPGLVRLGYRDLALIAVFAYRWAPRREESG